MNLYINLKVYSDWLVCLCLLLRFWALCSFETFGKKETWKDDWVNISSIDGLCFILIFLIPAVYISMCVIVKTIYLFYINSCRNIWEHLYFYLLYLLIFFSFNQSKYFNSSELLIDYITKIYIILVTWYILLIFFFFSTNQNILTRFWTLNRSYDN